MIEAPRLGPVRESDRIMALDVARGVALLGIFMVNIAAFSEAFGYFIEPVPREGRGPWEPFMWTVNKIFFEGRFYPLFSLLFGMGLAIQYQRAAIAGRRFVPMAARRMMVLAAIGMVHALLLWWGDILFIYGIVGLVMLALIGLSPRILTAIGCGAVALAVLLSIGFGALQVAIERQESRRAERAAATDTVVDAEIGAGLAKPDANDPMGAAVEDALSRPAQALADDPATAPHTAAIEAQAAGSASNSGESGSDAVENDPGAAAQRKTPFFAWLADVQTRGTEGPSDPMWIESETRAYREGPWLDAFLFRAMSWGFTLVAALTFFGWDVLAMFCIGAALMKWGIFESDRRRWAVVFVIAAAVVALPVSIATAMMLPTQGVTFNFMVNAPVQLIFGPVMSLGYLGAVILLVDRRLVPRALGVVAAAGRMAFTNYLMQTVLATAIFYHWGLGYFDSMNRLERAGVVLGIYAFQLAFSVAWLRFFAMGPLEWLWRAATYMRFTPLRRA
ncbi:MAG: DUF418 domain-containing protein [Phycisphaeraceae bacterium]|nr:DUF418 domain-containing protein [Phycisphaeraceae bacterium]